MRVVTVGVTGHSNITDDTAISARREIVKILAGQSGEIVGLTCLSRGADQAFADAVLETGGSLSVVQPAADYFENIPDPAAKERCYRYLASAVEKFQLDHAASSPAAYLDASRHLIDHCDVLIAVWDGSAPTGTGGTADAVEYAKQQGRRIIVVWPEGAQRSS